MYVRWDAPKATQACTAILWLRQEIEADQGQLIAVIVCEKGEGCSAIMGAMPHMKAWMGTIVNNMGTLYEALERSALVRECAQAFQETAKLGLTLLPLEATRQPLKLAGEENPICMLMSTTAGSCAACLKTKMQLLARLKRELSPQELCCFAGLSELAVPIVIGGQHVATLWGGQVFQRKPTRRQFDRMRRQLQAWGMKGKVRQLKQAFFHTPVVSERKFRAAVRLLDILAGHLAEHASRSLVTAYGDEPLPVIQAKAFVHAHASERIELYQVAKHVHLSASHFCKMFKKTTGMTFTAFVARVRMEKAKSLLGDLRMRMTEVSSMAGFRSISQFNRTFRRYVGVSPTAYRTSLSE